MLCGANNMVPDPRILKWCHLPPYTLVGQRLRGVQILPDCTGDRARVRKIHFFSPNACPLEEKSPFLSFLGATKTKPYSFWTKKVWPDWCHSYLHSGGMEIRGIWKGHLDFPNCLSARASVA